MSFKIKKWGYVRNVQIADLIPGLVGDNGNPLTNGFVYPWAGYILIGCYDGDGDAVWVKYDPLTHTAAGPYAGPGTPWVLQNMSWGPSTRYQTWGDQLLFGTPGVASFNYGSGTFWGWDTSFAFWVGGGPPATFGGGEARVAALSSFHHGQRGGVPSVMWYSASSMGAIKELGTVPYGGSYTALLNDPDIYIPFQDGTILDIRELGGNLFHGTYIPSVGVFKRVVWEGIPTETNKAGYMLEGSFGTDSNFSPMDMTFGLTPGGSVIMRSQLEGGSLQWTPSDDPGASGSRSWQTSWDYRHQLEGIEIDEYDLDGTSHALTYGTVVDGDSAMTRARDGYYYALEANHSPLSFMLRVLDPMQPSGLARRTSTAGGIMGWVGDYAIGSDYRLQHILPFPDSRDPVGGGVQPPQERDDGYLLGSKEVFQGRGASWQYKRDVSIDLSAYVHDADWLFPEEVGTQHPGFWQLFAGTGPTVIGYMPDYMYGALDPALNNAMRYLGIPAEYLSGTPTHVLSNAKLVTGATWATPAVGVYTGLRDQLICSHDGSVFVFTSNGLGVGTQPPWKAVAGKITGFAWETLVDFGAITPPDLGQTDWTIWSVVPIPKCRALPRGGYVVGATLYFAPWTVDWEFVPGTRDATFRDTGQGWVPAKLGWDGPMNNDSHAPVYLVATDEWTIGRSLYGPDALLVFDDQGVFVECLNNSDLHAPDGREVMVTGGPSPMLIYRIYRHGTYSDFAEYNDMYHRMSGNTEMQAPLYVAYDLVNAQGQIAPGAGTFRGFVDMYAVGDYAPKASGWRWDVAQTLYDWSAPRSMWTPPGSSYVRSARGGLTITPLAGGPTSARNGVRGVGSRA